MSCARLLTPASSLNSALAEREALRLGPKGYKGLYAEGVPEKCALRGAYS